MFKNYGFLVKPVKDKKPSKDAQPEEKPSLTDYADTITDVGTKVVFGAVIVLGSYLAFDTVRQVTIEIVKAKM